MLLDAGQYRNMFDFISFTPKEIEQEISQHHKRTIPFQTDDLSHIKLPTFIEAFYQFILGTNRIPDLEEFIGFYIGFNFGFVQHNIYHYKIKNLLERIAKSFPSLIREFHFCFMVKEAFPCMNIIYNIELDMKHDIDLLLEEKGKLYAIILYFDSVGSRKFRKLKENRHEHFENVHYLEIPFRKDEGIICGQYFLYNREIAFKNLLAQMKS